MLFSQQVFLVAGLSRSGVSAAEFLLSRGAKVYAYDDAEGESVQKAIVSLSEQGCRIVHREELSERAKECDILVLSPGIPIDHPLARFFRTHGKRVTGEMELGALALACPAVAVTGTNGKTTTVTMLERILRAAGKECFACGNSGFPLTAAAQKLKSGGVAAVEVSSFQLETLSSLRPHVAVVLNIAEDHLDRHYNMENYIYLKRKLLKNCTESEYAVLNRDDPVVRSFAEHTKAQTVWFSVKERVEGAYLEDDHLCFKGEKVLSTDDLSVRGEHNLANALAAVAAAKLMGVGNDAIASALSSFKGVSHRLEKVLEKDGVIYIDDSKATNVDSCLKAVAGLDRETVLLVGGKEKGEQFGPLFSALKRSRVVHAVLFGECAFRLMNAAMEENFTAVTLCRPFEVAVNVACLTARPGQNVLLSPAAASFDEFRSFEERGEKFASLVKAYAEPSASEAAAGDADGERGETGKRIDRLTEKSRALMFKVSPAAHGRRGRGDVLFLGGVVAIAALGVLFVYSASCYTAKVQYGDEFYFLKKQLLGFLLGLAAIFFFSRADAARWKKAGVPALVAAVLLLAAVFIPGLGKTSYGATRWLGLGPVTLQPSELAKFAFVLFSAGHFAFDPSRPRRFSGILPVLGAGASLCVLILLEPNLSVTMVMGALMLGMLFLAGTPKKTLLLILLPILLAIPVLIFAEPYRLRRLMAFLDPWSSPQDEGYQLIQSLYALANGDLFGVGLFSSRQKYRFLPFAESDFILSVIAEETGFFGVLCLFLLIGFVVWRGFCIAANARTFYEYLLVSGIMFAFAVQAALNALVVSGCVPPTGLPLPLVSAGNTSLIVTMAGMGVVFGVSRRQGGA